MLTCSRGASKARGTADGLAAARAASSNARRKRRFTTTVCHGSGRFGHGAARPEPGPSEVQCGSPPPVTRPASATSGSVERLDQRDVTQTAPGRLLGPSQPKVSALRSYKLRGFSVGRLMTRPAAVDQDVEIVIRL